MTTETAEAPPPTIAETQNASVTAAKSDEPSATTSSVEASSPAPSPAPVSTAPVPTESSPSPVAAATRKTAPPPPASAVDSARDQVNQMMQHNELDSTDSSSLQTLFREHEALKEKVAKLKALLGRSAKAQRETKVELDATNKRLEAAVKENERLQGKIDKLSSRPTHMELISDFETNFDRAMLSVGQAGGQDTAQPAEQAAATLSYHQQHNSSTTDEQGAVVDTLLMQELSESKQRIEKLEKLNSALVHRSSQLEADLKEAKKSMDELLNKLSRTELEKRMAEMEMANATKAMNEKAASLQEMQMEIDLVTKSAQKAAVRAAAGESLIKTVQNDKEHVQQLESKVQALQEWAVASNHAKTLAQEHVRLLENQLRAYQQQNAGATASGGGNGLSSNTIERIIDSKSASLVVGAGDVGARVFALDANLVKNSVNHLKGERVVLRWTFDLVHDDIDITFSILKGQCETAAARKKADALVSDRLVTGGAMGETENAFAIGNACTLVWCNSKSWIRPRTVKYKVEAVVLQD